jgi:hypothetical protein
VDLDGVGAVEVRAVTLRDVEGLDMSDRAWWHVAVRGVDGAKVDRDWLLDLPISAANQLAEEVMSSRPTQPPKGGSGG